MKKIIGVIFIMTTVLFLVSCKKDEPIIENTVGDSIFQQYTNDQLELTFNDFWKNTSNIHPNATLNDQREGMYDATLWDYSAYFTAGIRNLRIQQQDDKSRAQYDKIISGMDWYLSRNRNDDYLVYASENGNETPAFYDDNIWVLLGFIDSYKLTNNVEHLNKAKDIMEYIFTGWVTNIENDPYEGGLLWREFPRDANNNFLFTGGPIARNTCINGPAAMAGALLYQLTGDQKYLDWAIQIYDWTVKYLRAPSGLYYDNISLYADGTFRLDETVFTYNTGTMISAGVYLYEITKEESYLNDAIKSADIYQRAKSTDSPSGKGKLYLAESEPWFRVYLFLGYLDLAKLDSKYNGYIENAIIGIKELYETGLDDYGYLTIKWGTDSKEGNMKDLRHISGNIEGLAIFAEYEMFYKKVQ